jgi:hypothetical protein
MLCDNICPKIECLRAIEITAVIKVLQQYKKYASEYISLVQFWTAPHYGTALDILLEATVSLMACTLLC